MIIQIMIYFLLNTMRPEKNGRHFADVIFKYIFITENCGVLIQNSQKFAAKGPVNNKSALVQVKAWRLMSYKPLAITKTNYHPIHWHIYINYMSVFWPQKNKFNEKKPKSHNNTITSVKHITETIFHHESYLKWAGLDISNYLYSHTEVNSAVNT